MKFVSEVCGAATKSVCIHFIHTIYTNWRIQDLRIIGRKVLSKELSMMEKTGSYRATANISFFLIRSSSSMWHNVTLPHALLDYFDSIELRDYRRWKERSFRNYIVINSIKCKTISTLFSQHSWTWAHLFSQLNQSHDHLAIEHAK